MGWRRIVPLVGLCGLAGPSAHATTAGPLTELAAGTADQRAPAVAWDATQSRYVIVWEDGRNAANGVDLYAARLQASGALVDGSGCPILIGSAAAGDETQPAIAAVPGAAAVVVAWTEARSGLNDIFAARLLTSNCTSTGDVQVSSGSDVETSPAVSVGNQNVLVSYQVNLGAGGQVVRGRRFTRQLAVVDASDATLTGSGAARPTGLAIGASHLLAWEAAGDIFARLVPDTGPVAPGGAITVSSAALTQSRASLGLLGSGNAVVLWQDARAGAGNEDVFGRRYAANLSPLAAEASISGATAAQLSPQVSGDAVRGLAVWQDRRNGVINAIIYATRLDGSTGAVLDGDGFPLLVLPGNAFEQVVAKGPGADFLVAAVQLGNPSRIFYRVVRDEIPDGIMTAAGPLAAPADGVTPAAASFGPAVGASGFAVVDGTMYDVTLSAPSASLLQPDVDPIRAGHQIGSANGQVLASVVSSQAGSVAITVTSVEGGASTGTAMATFSSAPPSVSQVAIAPASPTSDDDLVVSYVYSHPNGNPESGSTIQWTRNDAVQGAFSDQTTVPASATRRGDRWRVSVTPSDGQSSGSPGFSNTVTISNGVPRADSVVIIPDTDVRSGTTLNGRYAYVDPDFDPESGTVRRWFRSDVAQGSLQNVDAVPGSLVDKGQTWRFEVVPSDGTASGAPVSSPEVTIVNTAPVANAGMDGTVIERRRYALDGTASSDLDSQDTLQFTWGQLVVGAEPQVSLSSTSSVTPSFVAPDVDGTTVLTFELTVSDGQQDSGKDRVRVQVEATPDSDGDGLDDVEEMLAGTDPSRGDTDRDALTDREEVDLGTNPIDEDTDDDGVRDGAEGRSCPMCQDFEPDADPDGDLVIAALDPDTDDDGLFDGTELSVRDPLPGGGDAPFVYAGTDEAAGFFTADQDPDTWTDARVADTDLDTILDGTEDANRNGRLDEGESDPRDPGDPGLPCGTANPCPDGLVCEAGACVAAPSTDGGMVCAPLTDGVQCCRGDCLTGEPVAAICRAGATREQCPVGAEQCGIDACMPEPTGNPPTAGSSCGCAAAPTPAGSGGWGLWLALAGLVAARRRQ